MQSRYDKFLIRAENIIRNHNDEKYSRSGIRFIEASKSGFMSIDIHILEDLGPVNKRE